MWSDLEKKISQNADKFMKGKNAIKLPRDEWYVSKILKKGCWDKYTMGVNRHLGKDLTAKF